MSFNTLKTILGFLKTLLRKWLPFESRADELSDIYNYLEISSQISTSGQPTEKQFSLIKAKGFDSVINLAPHSAENALDDEAGALQALDIKYIHIPVDFKAPSDSDFETFGAEMDKLKESKVWVHCAANMRVSAFIYRYRYRVLSEPEEVAKESLSRIWEPSGVWKEFVA